MTLDVINMKAKAVCNDFHDLNQRTHSMGKPAFPDRENYCKAVKNNQGCRFSPSMFANIFMLQDNFRCEKYEGKICFKS